MYMDVISMIVTLPLSTGRTMVIRRKSAPTLVAPLAKAAAAFVGSYVVNVLAMKGASVEPVCRRPQKIVMIAVSNFH